MAYNPFLLKPSDSEGSASNGSANGSNSGGGGSSGLVAANLGKGRSDISTILIAAIKTAMGLGKKTNIEPPENIQATTTQGSSGAPTIKSNGQETIQQPTDGIIQDAPAASIAQESRSPDVLTREATNLAIQKVQDSGVIGWGNMTVSDMDNIGRFVEKNIGPDARADNIQNFIERLLKNDPELIHTIKDDAKKYHEAQTDGAPLETTHVLAAAMTGIKPGSFSSAIWPDSKSLDYGTGNAGATGNLAANVNQTSTPVAIIASPNSPAIP